MAINLCVYYEAPKPLINRLKELRKKIDKDKLADRRNTAVHGVQRRGENEGEVIMTMPRVPGENKHTTLTAIQIGALANEIVVIQREADSIFREIGDWKFGEHNSEDIGSKIRKPDAGTWLKFTQNIKARVNHFLRSFKS